MEIKTEKDFFNFLNKEIKKNNIKNKELAKKINIGESSIGRYRSKIQAPNLRAFIKLINFFGYKILLKKSIK